MYGGRGTRVVITAKILTHHRYEGKWKKVCPSMTMLLSVSKYIYTKHIILPALLIVGLRTWRGDHVFAEAVLIKLGEVLKLALTRRFKRSAVLRYLDLHF